MRSDKILAALTGMILGIGMALAGKAETLAAPRLMPDGGIFDAEYYGAQNGDVQAAFGWDEKLLYAHYVMFGRTEGRLPYDPATPETYLEQLRRVYYVTIGDRIISSVEREVDLSGLDLRTVNLPEALMQLPNLEKLTMIGCGLDNAGYAALQDAFPRIRMIWEIQYAQWKLRTDAVAFSTMRATPKDARLYDEDAYYLRYCKDMIALDIGHNGVHDLSFLRFMPDLRVLIIVDNQGLWDLSPLKYCPGLRYLEIFVNRVSDLSVLQYLPELEDLNISYNPIVSAGYIKGLPHLKRLWMESTGISAKEVAELKTLYPGLELVNKGEGSVDQGWRTGERYEAMRSIFRTGQVNAVYH